MKVSDKQGKSPVKTRREFIKLAGITAAAISVPGVFAACSDDDAPVKTTAAPTTAAPTTAAPTTAAPATAAPATAAPATAAPATTVAPAKLLEVRYGYGNPETTLAGFTNQQWPLFATRRTVNLDAASLQPSVSTQALASGRFDIVDFSPITSLNLHVAGGGKPRIIAHSQPVNDYMIVANRDNAPTINDLEGKIFGISSPGSISYYIPRLVFAEVGVDPDTMEFMRIGGTSSRATALIAGAIDGGAVYSDVAFALIAANPNLYIAANCSDYVTLIFSSLNSNDEFLDDSENRDGIVRLLMARAELMKFILQEKEEFFGRYVDRFGERVEQAALDQTHAFYVNSGMWDPDLNMNLEGLTETVRISREEVDPPFAQGDLPLSDWVDTSFRDEAIDRLGGEGWWR
jgi:ABC-type nitrate/sulfonate/bicarbonate transport system substrate-binding protein